MDQWMIGVFDKVAGKWQERGIPLPAIHEQAATALMVSAGFWVFSAFWHSSIAMGVILTVLTIPVFLGGIMRLRDLRRDVARMDVKSVFLKYAFMATTERLSTLMKCLRVFGLVFFLMLLIMVGFSVYAGEPISPELAILTYSLTMTVDMYIRTVIPRAPVAREEEHELTPAYSR
jgi:acyl-CoA synthetase (AMP-forming)/AMP-acid ligase II